ncbi:hypothetical protein WISP_122632 [Willisornis vidua]|uniref:Uncharacterized protein n=1 Tax=Willisornis vidua TaxID=1566151 RepID=A0ABQ9CT07_9PASS|nr:hypothetical protein WISP_122632 [Willisornis vidua]
MTVSGPKEAKETRCYVGLYTRKQRLTRLIAGGKVKVSLDCSDNMVVEFRILRGGSKTKRKTRALHYRRVAFDLLKDLLGRIPWKMVLEQSPGELIDFSRIAYSKLRKSKKDDRRMHE